MPERNAGPPYGRRMDDADCSLPEFQSGVLCSDEESVATRIS